MIFFYEKTFDKTILYLQKYNIDFAWLTQAAYIGKLFMLQNAFTKKTNLNFYYLSIKPEPLADFFIKPQIYYYFYLNNYVWNFDEFEVAMSIPDSYGEHDFSTLQLFSNSLFIAKNAFSTKTVFFEIDNFKEIWNIHRFFDANSASNLELPQLKRKYINEDKFWLAKFLFNPMLLQKYPNFVFLYGGWLHKSWQVSKWWLLQSLKLYDVSYGHGDGITAGITYFFSKYIWFFFAMKKLNFHVAGNESLGTGITWESLKYQLVLLHLRLYTRNTMYAQIREVWFYLWAYIRYFSYEGWINLNWSWFIFKKLYSFWTLLRQIAISWDLTTSGLLSFTETFFCVTIKKKIIQPIFNIFFCYPRFLKFWYIFMAKIFLLAMKISKIIFSRRWISIFIKFNLINSITNLLFFTKFSGKFKFLTIFPKNDLESWLNYFNSVWVNYNSLIIFCLFFFWFNLALSNKKFFKLVFKSTGFINTEKNLESFTHSKTRILAVYDSYYDVWQMVKYSDWMSIAGFPYKIIYFFLWLSGAWKLIRKKKFSYFFLILSHLNPKTFFWIFTDLTNLTQFTLVVHISIIFWQNFFFFYLFILKCLKKMYASCVIERLLYLIEPKKTLLQRTWSYKTLFDLFSVAFKSFLPMGVGTIFTNIEYYDNLRYAFSLADVASKLAIYGKPNNWLLGKKETLSKLNKFTTTEELSESPFFIPLMSINFSTKAFFTRRNTVIFEKKNWFSVNVPVFTNWIPIHIIIEHFSNVDLNASLIVTFVRKKLEREYELSEILWNLNTLVSNLEFIKGFMFLLKGWFSRKERASKVWLKKGKLLQVNVWTKIDYCKQSATLKYGAVSIWVWLLLNNIENTLRAAI